MNSVAPDLPSSCTRCHSGDDDIGCQDRRNAVEVLNEMKDEKDESFLIEYLLLEGNGKLDQSFPLFPKSSAFQEYHEWKKSRTSAISYLLCCLCASLLITRLNLTFINSHQNRFIGAGQVLTILYIFLSGLFVSANICVYTSKSFYSYKNLHYFPEITLKYLSLDILGVLCSLLVAFNFVGRVVQGQCPQGTSIWTSQRCNPEESSNSFPQELVLLLFVIPLTHQVVLQVEFCSVIVQYLVAYASIVYAIIAVNGWQQVYTLVCSMLLVNVSFEFERMMRVRFIRSKIAWKMQDKLNTTVMEKEHQRVILGNVVSKSEFLFFLIYFS